ncbi:MAG: hypothetical protein WCP29_03295 [Acidobacteriota bacterium]
MKTAAGLAVAMLGAFHGWLLWTHLVGGKALEPRTAVRWVVAALVLVGFRALQRHGLSLFWGKRAIVLWLLVVVLHCHAVWNGEPVTVQLGVPESISLLAQLTAPAASILGLLCFALIGALLAHRVGQPCYVPATVRIAGLPASGYVFRFAPRPPPVA